MRRLRTRSAHRRWLVLVPLLLTAACGGDDEALSPRCLRVEDGVVTAVASRLAPPGGSLRHAYAVRSDDRGVYFLSAELVLDGRNERRGDILTWTTADPRAAADDYRAVDTKAKELSEWDEAPDGVRITTEGAILSRSCVNTRRPS